MKNWNQPNGGIHGYLQRFVDSGDSTFQHIAIWTLLQLLESEDKNLINMISVSDNIVNVIKGIADRNVESDDEDGEDGKGEVVDLARRCLEHLGLENLGQGPKTPMSEGTKTPLSESSTAVESGRA